VNAAGVVFYGDECRGGLLYCQVLFWVEGYQIADSRYQEAIGDWETKKGAQGPRRAGAIVPRSLRSAPQKARRSGRDDRLMGREGCGGNEKKTERVEELKS
jgi:hypothetical protein